MKLLRITMGIFAAVLLAHTKNRAASQAFLDFLKSPEAVKIIRDFGYETPAVK